MHVAEGPEARVPNVEPGEVWQAAARDTATDAPPLASVSVHPAAEPQRVVRTFIVEDSAIILDNLVATLEEMTPVRVVGHAADEAGALSRLVALQGEVDLVIVDVFLKAGSGLGILRGATRTGLQARRVVLTNYATPDMREKCKALGADRVFDKSNDLEELLSYCTRLAEGHEGREGCVGHRGADPSRDDSPPGASN